MSVCVVFGQCERRRQGALAQTKVGGHQEIGAVERANGTVQAQLRVLFFFET